MAELKNTFSWSFSAASDFDECRRRRYWAKYGAWGGWDKRAGATQQKAYQLNKMGNRYSLQGQAVEMAVMWVLKEHQSGRTPSVDQAYEAAARPYLNRCWKESRDGEWRKSPKKHFCFREHYYREPGALDRTWTGSVIEETKVCIANFIERVLPRLADVTRESEVPIATPEKGGDVEFFTFERVKVYAIPDYVYRTGDLWHIHDWKSGKAKAEHRNQLALYGLWANIKHGVEPDRIVVFLEYLRDGVMKYEQVTAEMLDSAREHIRSSVADMADFLVDEDIGRNEALPKEEWDLAVTRSPCRFCNFYELCEPEFREDESVGGE